MSMYTIYECIEILSFKLATFSFGFQFCFALPILTFKRLRKPDLIYDLFHCLFMIRFNANIYSVSLPVYDVFHCLYMIRFNANICSVSVPVYRPVAMIPQFHGYQLSPGMPGPLLMPKANSFSGGIDVSQQPLIPRTPQLSPASSASSASGE